MQDTNHSCLALAASSAASFFQVVRCDIDEVLVNILLERLLPLETNRSCQEERNMNSNPKYRNAGLSSYYASFRADDTLISILPAFDFQPSEDTNHLFQSTLPSTNFGPFKAGMEATVPLWIAIVLQQRSFGQIVLPAWLSAANLSHIIQYEKRHALLFPTTKSFANATKTKDDGWNAVEDDPDEENTAHSTTVDDATKTAYSLPEHYYEVALRLTSASNSSTSDASVLSLLVQDLFEIRLDKLRQQFQTLLEETVKNSNSSVDLIINVTGIGTQELTAIQPYVQQALQDMYMLASNNNSDAKEEPEVMTTQRRSSSQRRLR